MALAHVWLLPPLDPIAQLEVVVAASAWQCDCGVWFLYYSVLAELFSSFVQDPSILAIPCWWNPLGVL